MRDDGFEALLWFDRMYYRITRLHPYIKIDENTGVFVLYNHMRWIIDAKHMALCNKLIKKLHKKWPSLKGE
jgi:hypothetical protein